MAREIRSPSFRALALGAIGSLFALGTWSHAEPALASGESGGSGLFRVEQAYSMPIGRPLFSFYGGYFSSDTSDGGSKLFTLIPSVTWGLGGGFEGAVALPLEGLTTSLDSLAYDRRIDVRKRDLVAKFRWTTPLGASSSRLGVQAVLGLPLGDSTRPGGDRTPSLNLDPGLMAMYSTNFGGLRYPLRIHANAGYWWSRDDGAFYFRDFPDALPIATNGSSSNDVLIAAIGVEVGFRRFVGLAELETQQFTQARSQLDSSENLWLLTLGLRAALSPTIGMTAGVAFDLSSDDPTTAFDPGDFYPGVEYRLGFTFGGVMSREAYEARRATEQERKRGNDVVEVASPEPSPPTASKGKVPDSTPPSRPIDSDSETIRMLEARIAQLEINTRLSLLETRLRMLEGSPAARPRTTPDEAPLREQIEALQMQILLLQEELVQSEASQEAATKVPDTQAPTSESRSTPVAETPPSTPERNEQSRVQERPEARRELPTPLAASPPPVRLDIDRSAPTPAPPPPQVVVVAPSTLEVTPRGETPSPPKPSNPGTAPVNEPEADLEAVTEVEPEVLEESPVDFPLGVGDRTLLEDIELESEAPLQSPRARETLDTLAGELQARHDVRVVLSVHGGGNDRETALSWTTEQAEMLRNYLVVAGADPEQVVALGLGAAESPVASVGRVEIERIR